MTGWLLVAIVAVVVGLVFVMGEVLMPSGGLLALFSAVCLVGAIIWAFLKGGVSAGISFILAELLLVPVILYAGLKVVFPKTPLGRRMIIEPPRRDEVSGAGATRDFSYLLGKEGVASSDLRPAGVAIIDGERVNVVSEGTVIEVNTRVKVVSVSGNRIVVRPVRVG